MATVEGKYGFMDPTPAEGGLRPVLVDSVQSLLDDPLPASVANTPFATAPIAVFRTGTPEQTETTAVYGIALSPAQWWDLLQGSAPYKNEWPSAVTTDWEMYKQRAKSHAWLGPAWNDLIPHLDVFKSLMQPRNENNYVIDPKTVPEVLPLNYIVPVSRWRTEGTERTLITEHTATPRDPRVEESIRLACANLGVVYDAERIDELAGFMVNTLFAHKERAGWKPFMSHKGVESDHKLTGNNFIGPAQVTTRALLERGTILTNSFYRNAEAVSVEYVRPEGVEPPTLTSEA